MSDRNGVRESRIHHLQLPVTREQVSEIAVGDMVYLNGDIVVTIGLPTHQRIIDHAASGEPLPQALREGAFFHLSCFNREEEDGSWEALYMNPSTSTRYNSYMPRIIRALDLRMVGGKGGLDAASVEAMRETGSIYLSFLGGGCTLLSQALRGVVQVGWPDMLTHYRLVRLKVEGLGPCTVAIDAHGNSCYADAQARARDRLPRIMAALDARRESAAPDD